jgi:hypothetical protein
METIFALKQLYLKFLIFFPFFTKSACFPILFSLLFILFRYLEKSKFFDRVLITLTEINRK